MKILIINNKLRLNQQKNLVAFFESRDVESDEISHRDLRGINLSDYFAICLSGTGRPVIDSSNCYSAEIDLIQTTSLPVLGICGGFHLMALAYGGTVRRMEAAIYGRQQVELASDQAIYGNMSETGIFLSKHLYCLDYIPPKIKIIARHKQTDCVYGIKISGREQYGFQFHPERRNDGTLLLDSFLQLAKEKLASVIDD